MDNRDIAPGLDWLKIPKSSRLNISELLNTLRLDPVVTAKYLLTLHNITSILLCDNIIFVMYKKLGIDVF